MPDAVPPRADPAGGAHLPGVQSREEGHQLQELAVRGRAGHVQVFGRAKRCSPARIMNMKDTRCIGVAVVLTFHTYLRDLVQCSEWVRAMCYEPSASRRFPSAPWCRLSQRLAWSSGRDVLKSDPPSVGSHYHWPGQTHHSSMCTTHSRCVEVGVEVGRTTAPRFILLYRSCALIGKRRDKSYKIEKSDRA